MLDKCPIKEGLNQIITHLASAHAQSHPSDDQIIMNHLRAALVVAETMRQFVDPMVDLTRLRETLHRARDEWEAAA